MSLFDLFEAYFYYSNTWRVLVTIMPLYIGLIMLLVYHNLGSQINHERKIVKEIESTKSKNGGGLNQSGLENPDEDIISDVYTFESEGN